MKELKKNIVFGILLVAFIIAFEILMARLALPAWPAFMVMIFFFIVHEDLKAAPAILVGGLAGLFCVVLLEKFIPLAAQVLDHESAKLLFIGLFVFSIVIFKDIIPWVFNSFAFMFFLVGALAKNVPGADPRVWIGVELVVGSLFIAGIVGIVKITAVLIKEQD